MSPWIDNSPRCVEWDTRVVDWSPFQQVYLFPPVPILEQLLPKISKFSGTGLLIAPYLNGPALAPLVSKAKLMRRLPDSYFLFQMIGGKMVERKKFYDYWMWVF